MFIRWILRMWFTRYTKWHRIHHGEERTLCGYSPSGDWRGEHSEKQVTNNSPDLSERCKRCERIWNKSEGG